MRTLIYCASVYHLLNAINIRMHVLKEDNIDLLLTDAIPEQEQLAIRIRGAAIFDNVYTSTGKSISRGEYKHSRANIYLFRIFPEIILKQAGISLINSYDRFYFATFDELTNFVYLKLHRQNSNIETCCFEDGASTYICSYQSYNSVDDRLYRLFHIKPLGMANVPLMVYEPSLVVYDCKSDILQLPKISAQDNKFVSLINKIFDYKYSEKEIKNNIFFEDAYLAEGMKNNDEELINKCFELTRGNIQIKPHPRNPYNRFINKGMMILESKIPWEVFCLNLSMKDKTFITIQSNAAISPHIFFDDAPKTILLYKLLQGTRYFEGVEEYEEYYKRLKKIYSSSIIIPNSFKELEDAIKCFCKET